MNREQKRAFAKQIKKAKKTELSKEAIEQIKEYADMTEETSLTIPEGTKVKLNIERITKNKDFVNYREEFKQFVVDNRNKIFTVEYDEIQEQPRNLFVCLKEDPTPLKWLFYVGDLIPIKE